MNGDEDEMRSVSSEVVDDEGQIDMFGGVGARQKETPGSQEGGGYLDICNLPNFAFYAKTHRERTTLAELELVLPEYWFGVASRVGAPKFVELWLAMLAERQGSETETRYTPPTISRLNRLVRNWVVADASGSMSITHLQQQLGQIGVDGISRRSVQRTVRNHQKPFNSGEGHEE